MIKERRRKYGERRATTGPSGGLGGRERERKKKARRLWREELQPFGREGVESYGKAIEHEGV